MEPCSDNGCEKPCPECEGNMDKEIEPQHTPTPWNINGSDIYGELHTIARMVDSAIPEDEQEANAAFIVCAVNAHNDLLEIAKEALCELDPDCKYDGVNWEKGMSDMERLIIGLYEAIAKAEGH